MIGVRIVGNIYLGLLMIEHGMFAAKFTLVRALKIALHANKFD